MPRRNTNASVLSIYFTARVRSDMNLADSSVVYCVFWSVFLSNIQCCCQSKTCVVVFSRSSKTSAPSMQTFVHRCSNQVATRMFFVLHKLFLGNETELISQSQCVFRIVKPKRNLQRFHATFLRKISTVVKNPGSNTFTSSYPEGFHASTAQGCLL